MPARALFVLLCAALVLAALVSTRSTNAPDGAPTASRQTAIYSPPTPPRPPSPRAPLRPRALGFLATFLRYEAGEPYGPPVLNSLASRPFAAQLLADPPRAPRPPPPRARLEHLALHLLPGRPPRALVTARALRGTKPEQLAFLFEARVGRWLAVAPAE